MITLYWRHERISIILSEISFDTSGVTLHFRDYPKAIYFISTETSLKTQAQLKEIFPTKLVERYSVRISLGEFIDNVQKIT